MRMALWWKEDTVEVKKILDFLSAKRTMQILAVLQLSLVELPRKLFTKCWLKAELWQQETGARLLVVWGGWGLERMGFQHQRVR